MKRIILTSTVFAFLIIGGTFTWPAIEKGSKDLLIRTTAREIIDGSKYCNLISMGEDGYPNARIMDPFKPDKGWVIWMGTNLLSRKVREIKKNRKISVFYESPGGDGYVTLKGTGTINNEKENKKKYFKPEWKEFYPVDRKYFVLIKFIPEKLEIVSYKKGLLGDKVTWEAPSVKLK